MYQSWFYSKWRVSANDNETDMLFQYHIHNPGLYNDDNSVVSNPPILRVDTLQACAGHWSNLPLDVKEA